MISDVTKTNSIWRMFILIIICIDLYNCVIVKAKLPNSIQSQTENQCGGH